MGRVSRQSGKRWTRGVNPGVAADTLVGLASLVLDKNYFEFNDKIYRQKLGTAIRQSLLRPMLIFS